MAYTPVYKPFVNRYIATIRAIYCCSIVLLIDELFKQSAKYSFVSG